MAVVDINKLWYIQDTIIAIGQKIFEKASPPQVIH